MDFTDVALPILGFVVVINSLKSIKKGLTRKEKIDAAIGFLIMIFSCWAYITNSKTLNDITNANDTLNVNIKTLLERRKTDSSNNATFQKYLKDTFGIIKQGVKPIIYNTKIYNSKVQEVKPNGLADSINYQYSLKNDTLFLAPKEGTWAHGYIAFDTANGTRFESMLHEGMGTPNLVDKININGRIYITHIFKMYDRAVYKQEPISLRMSGDLNRYIIFGDERIPSKRYFYKQGKVIWIPERS
jgi:hypothetical protein